MNDNTTLQTDVAHGSSTFTGSQLQIDPVSGYLIFRTPYMLPIGQDGKVNEANWKVMEVRRMIGFSPAKKVKFLESYRKTFPNMSKAAKLAGVETLTVKRHLNLDLKFRNEFDHLMADMREKTLQRFDDMGKNAKNFMDRIVVAKVMFPETFDKDKRVVLSHEQVSPEASRRRLNELSDVVDAEVVQAQFDPNELEERKAGKEETVSTLEACSINQYESKIT